VTLGHEEFSIPDRAIDLLLIEHLADLAERCFARAGHSRSLLVVLPHMTTGCSGRTCRPSRVSKVSTSRGSGPALPG
jgi:hypothetical protein